MPPRWLIVTILLWLVLGLTLTVVIRTTMH
jgi:hypothetical protein